MDIDDQSHSKKCPSHHENSDHEKIFHSKESKEEEKVPDPKNTPNKKHLKKKQHGLKHKNSISSSEHDGGRIRPRNSMSKVKDKQA